MKNNSVTEVQFSFCAVYPAKAHLVVFNVTADGCNCQTVTALLLGRCHPPEKRLSPSPPQQPQPCSVHMESCLCAPCLAAFTGHVSRPTRDAASISASFVAVTFWCVAGPQFTRPFTCGWAFGWLQHLAAAPCVSVSMCVSCVISVFSHLLGMYPAAEQLARGGSVFSLLRSHPCQLPPFTFPPAVSPCP